MNRVVGLFVAVALAAGGCGDPDDSLSPTQLVDRLRALPGVTVEDRGTPQLGVHYYVLHFTQPVDHTNPGRGTFQQEVSLLHRDTAAPVPMIVYTTGYSDSLLDRSAELTALLTANQISIEHRYFGESRPSPTDWTQLTITQAAADEHEIISALRTIYGGAFLTTGASKGGMTAVFHRRFYPDDVDGTVAYVTPISFGVPDPRYAEFVDGIGPAACRQAVRDVAIELLAHRRDAVLDRGHPPADRFTRLPLGVAVESAIVDLEWTFWQYTGVQGCATVPAVTADDDAMLAFLGKISPVADASDDSIAPFEAYYYQAYAQLGYPDAGTDYLAPYLLYSDADYAGLLPTATPPFDLAAMPDIDDFVRTHGERLLFVYGGWDPWSGGEYALGAATDSAIYVQDEGTHRSRIATLAPPDRDAVFAKLAAWTGVVPVLPMQSAPRSKAGDALGPAITAPPIHEPRVRLRAPRAVGAAARAPG